MRTTIEDHESNACRTASPLRGIFCDQRPIMVRHLVFIRFGLLISSLTFKQMLRNLHAAKWNSVSDQVEMFSGAVSRQ